MKKYVTLDWMGRPITTNGDGYILPRDAEVIINSKYYPTGTLGEWPVDPETGKKLPIEPQLNKNGSNMIPINPKSKTQRALLIAGVWIAAIVMFLILIGLVVLSVAKDIAIWKWFINN